MKNEALENLLKRLVEIEPTESPMISCVVNLEYPRETALREIEARGELAAKRLTGVRRQDFEDAFEGIQGYLRESLEPGSSSALVYSRWGDEPTFTALQFDVPLATELMVDSIPHIYPLIELKDTYHRFVIVITTETEARILETTIGSITEEIMQRRPELRRRIGREWTREHYQNHRRDREDRFIREKIRIVDDLMRRRGHNHLVVTGSPNMVGRLTAALPPRLKEKLISSFPANPKGGLDPILAESMQLFAAAENVESHDRVEALQAAVLSGGLGVAGSSASLEALQSGCADLLVVDQDHCEEEWREALVRSAVLNGVGVETVKRSDVMQGLGGSGCLLRYRPMPAVVPEFSVAVA
ncbi:MAG: hypothetical protein AAGD22_03685 [Verrucomicrobiota bacterium]